MKVVFSAQAKAQLREIALFIGHDDKARAVLFVRRLRDKAEKIGDMPRAFPLVPRYEHHGIRRPPFGNYLIFDRIEDSRVAIVHIVPRLRARVRILISQSLARAALPVPRH